MTSCGTGKTVYEARYPDLEWPDFPKINGHVNEDLTVLISMEEFVNLAEFKVDYDSLKIYYKEIKKRGEE